MGVCSQLCSELSTCQLSYRAREIFSKFLCSKATTPVNIDSQAQLADDILNAPHPDMFKEQQLQVTLQFSRGLPARDWDAGLSQSSMLSAGEEAAGNVGMARNLPRTGLHPQKDSVELRSKKPVP